MAAGRNGPRMELQTGLVTPEFDELDSDLYNSIVKQLENQRSTINLLHLQLKKQNNGDSSQAIAEKDKIIVALEKKVNALREGDGSLGQQQKLKEMESDILDLEQRISDKSRELRITQQKYNDHLNHLTKQLAASKVETEKLHNDDSLSEKINSLTAELEAKDSENLQLTEQLRITRTQLEQSSEGDEGLMSEIQTLRAELANKIDIDTDENQLSIGSEAYTKSLNTEIVSSLLDFHGRLLQMSEKANQSEWITETQNHFIQILSDLQITTFDSIGESIDENRHQVAELVYSTEHQHNLVFRELRKGFMHHGQIFQKASVVATRNPAHCQSCGFESTRQSKFCSECGVRLEMEEVIGIDPEIKPLNDSENARSYLELAQSYILRKDYSQAEQAITKARSLNPGCSISVIEHVRIMENRGDFDLARQTLEQFKNEFGKSNSVERCIERLDHKSKIIDLLRELH